MATTGTPKAGPPIRHRTFCAVVGRLSSHEGSRAGLLAVPDVPGVERPPVGGLGNDRLERTHGCGNGRISGADASCAGFKCAHGLQHLLAELDDGQVAGTQALMGTVSDWSHRHPHRDVLVRKAGDAGEVAGLHGHPVLPEMVVPIAQRPVGLIQIDADLLAEKLACASCRCRAPGTDGPRP